LISSRYRDDFPILRDERWEKPLVYLDNACMTLKPKRVVDKLVEYYTQYPGCGGRSLHKITARVTEEFEGAREKVADFLNCPETEGIVFTKNTTESINLVSHSFPFEKGDIVLGTDHEHNSNLVPWLLAEKERGIDYRVLPSSEDHSFDIERFKEEVKGVRLVSMVHVSNLDGRRIPVRDITEIAHDNGAMVFFDCAQSVPHMRLDMTGLDIDLLAFSGHKACGPTGTGVLAGKVDLLRDMKPFIAGGDTVRETTYHSVDFLDPPKRFEAGLQNYAGMIAMGEGLRYLEGIGLEEIERHEKELNRYASNGLPDQVRIRGPEKPEDRGGILPFNITGLNSHDIAMMLDEFSNIEVRSGRHCVHSWFNSREEESTARASFYLYNNKEEVDAFIGTIERIIEDFL